MSYTVKTILSWLGAWLALSAVGLGLSAMGSGPYDIIAGIVGIFVFGGILSVAAAITGAVILLGKHDGDSTKSRGFREILDVSERPRPLPYQERGVAHLAAGGLILLVGGSVCLGMV